MRRIALLLPLVLVLLVGCGDLDLRFGGLDTGPLEEAIQQGIEADVDGIAIDRVECPRGVDPQRGNVFVCRAHAVDGSVGTVEVRQVDDEGGVEWELTDVAPPATGG